MDDPKRAFWMVWNPSGASPMFRHDSENNAIHEAERLAKGAPGEKFFVLPGCGAAHDGLDAARDSRSRSCR